MKQIIQSAHPPIAARVTRLTTLTALSFTQISAAFPPGVSIPIENAGFEAQAVATNCFQGFIPSGWSLYDPNGIYDGAVDAVGGLNTQPGGPHFVEGAPEGDHVALVFLQGDIGRGSMGLVQELDAALEANTTYTLTVQVGNIASGMGPPPCDVFGHFHLDGFPGYQVQLLAGGEIVAQDDNSLAGMFDDGHWALSTVQISIPSGRDAHPQLGLPLAVRLINLNMIDTPMNPGIEVDFDDVQLVTSCGATGDLDGDETVDLDDLSILVNVLLEMDTDPLHVDAADMDCSGTADALDILRFVNIVVP